MRRCSHKSCLLICLCIHICATVIHSYFLCSQYVTFLFVFICFFNLLHNVTKDIPRRGNGWPCARLEYYRLSIYRGTVLHTIHHWMINFGQTLNSRKTAMPRPNGRAMAVFGELFREKWPRDIGSALYIHSHSWIRLWTRNRHAIPLTPGPAMGIYCKYLGENWLL